MKGGVDPSWSETLSLPVHTASPGQLSVELFNQNRAAARAWERIRRRGGNDCNDGNCSSGPPFLCCHVPPHLVPTRMQAGITHYWMSLLPPLRYQRPMT